MLLGGARAHDVDLRSRPRRSLHDPRLKAAVGYVPYFGSSVSCRPSVATIAGVDGVTLPYLAISGTADTTAPIGLVEDGDAPARGHAPAGRAHRHCSTATTSDCAERHLHVDAQLLDGQSSRTIAPRARRVTRMDVGRRRHARTSSASTTWRPRRPRARRSASSSSIYNPSLDHYFITAEPAEIAMLEQGVVVPGWQRTGFEFKSWRPAGSALGLAACRFFGTPAAGPNSHFFTIDAERVRDRQGESALDVRRARVQRRSADRPGDLPGRSHPSSGACTTTAWAGRRTIATHQPQRDRDMRATAGCSRDRCSARYP